MSNGAQTGLPDRVKLRLEPREIPIPPHLSEEARIFIAKATLACRISLPQTQDAAAWHDAKAERDEINLPMREVAYSRLPVTVETITIGACPIYVATPHALPASAAPYAILDIHGGGLVFGAGRATQLYAMARAAGLGCRVFSPDYRTPPDHPYPAALQDCLDLYRHLLTYYDPAQIAIGGVSAGGNLAAATLLRARDENLPLPAAALLLTPQLDLTESGDSFYTNRDIDVALPGPWPEANRLYANGADLAQPYISPLFADFTKGFPPAFLQSGTRDLFLSNTVRMHRTLLRAGCQAELHVWEAMPHAGFGGAAPEDTEVFQAIRDFLTRAAGWTL